MLNLVAQATLNSIIKRSQATAPRVWAKDSAFSELRRWQTKTPSFTSCRGRPTPSHAVGTSDVCINTEQATTFVVG